LPAIAGERLLWGTRRYDWLWLIAPVDRRRLDDRYRGEGDGRLRRAWDQRRVDSCLRWSRKRTLARVLS